MKISKFIVMSFIVTMILVLIGGQDSYVALQSIFSNVNTILTNVFDVLLLVNGWFESFMNLNEVAPEPIIIFPETDFDYVILAPS